MAKSTQNTASLAQQRSAQAAQAFVNRPEAGVQGAPQNRAERRAAARKAQRKPTKASVRKVAPVRMADDLTGLNAAQIISKVPGEVAREAKETAKAVRTAVGDHDIFPWWKMKFSLPMFIL